MQKRYGYTNGADEFFAYITQEYPEISRIPSFLSTHPTPPERVKRIQSSFAPALPGVTPLPDSGIRGTANAAPELRR
ncbi:hypothetical protein FACS1894185_3200 [Betaproteobacteria bacterium]|nr:hypothetical protein FACS1894185_3200 [Betaproteobacteria bacterium]